MLQRIKTSFLFGLAVAVSIIAIIMIAATHEIVPFGAVLIYDVIRVVVMVSLTVAAMYLLQYGMTHKFDD